MRHKTNPGLGYVHAEEHCDLCAAQVAWCMAELEKAESTRYTVAELARKRRDSEVRNEVEDKRARNIARGGVAVGIGAWIPQLIELIHRLAGG